MGTVEKIVETMHKLCNDKKGQVTRRYDQHSSWLQGELKQIRDLLQNTVSEELPPMEASSQSSQNDMRQKRKSPEMCLKGERSSPMPKRTSTDYAELCVAAGLPADLNKLKKDQLLEELANRGNVTMTMKALKKDLVDALKALVLDIHLRNLRSQEVLVEADEPMEEGMAVDSPKKMSIEPIAAESIGESPIENTVSEEAATALAPISACDVPPSTHAGRKPSLFSSLRSQLQSPAKPAETEAERSLRIEAEYKARINRHRTSQGEVEVVVNEEAAAEDVVLEVPVMDIASPVKSPVKSPMQSPVQSPAQSPVKSAIKSAAKQPQELPVEEPEVVVEDEDIPAEDDEEVEEEPVEEEEQLDMGSGDSTATEEVEENVDECSVAQESVVNADDTWNEVPSPKASPKTVKKSVTSDPKSANKIPRPRLQSDDTTDSKASAATNIKKPSNLVGGGQLSFLSSSSNNNTGTASAAPKQKTVVPALLLAQKQKEREEQKLLQKKRDLEEKKRKLMEKNAQASGTSIPTAKPVTSNKPITSASIAMNNGAARVPVTASGAPSGKPAPVPAKKGLFGWGGKSAAAETQETVEPEANDENANPTSSIPPPPAHAPDMSHALKEMPVETAPAQPVQVSQFPINDSEDSDDSETDDDESAAKKEDMKKLIPSWAKGQQLREALERQFGLKGEPPVDPDALFGDVRPCNLEEIFGKSGGKCGKYSARTSSAKWDADQITLVEKRKYKVTMGYV